MADLFRLVTLNPSTGASTTLKDLNDLTTYYTVRETFTVKPPDRQTAYAASSRRYAGSRAVSEAHQNGTIAWSMMVKGASSDAVLANAEATLLLVEDTVRDVYLEWRPDGATNSTYYEVRGPASWNPTYKWAQFVGARSMQVDFTIPVGPLARGARTTVSVGALTTPVTASVTIPGDAPALVDVSLTHAGGSPAPVWTMVGWQRPTSAISPGAGSFNAISVAQAESFTNLITWASAADALYMGGNGLKGTAAGAFGAQANFGIVADPPAEDWSPDAYVEVWGRVQLASTIVSPKLTTWVQTVTNARTLYSTPYGSGGKLITPPNSGTAFRFVHLGTIVVTPGASTVGRVMFSGGAGSTGAYGLDYLVLVPTNGRALGPTGKANNSSYPAWLVSTGAVQKIIYNDLSTGMGSQTAPDVGMGGSTIQMEPGVNTILVKNSTLVPDDPTLDATSEGLTYSLTNCQLFVWPRYFLARGA